MRGLIIDIGGVLARQGLIDVVDTWAVALGSTRDSLLAAVYGGNDDAVLVGRTGEDDWWRVVRERLDVSDEIVRRLRADLEASETWDDTLVAAVRGARPARTAILSNAWPSQRRRMTTLGLVDLVDELLLSCEIGVAKPAPAAFRIALERLGTRPDDTLFVDDTPGHVAVAASLGLAGHVHVDTAGTVEVIKRFVA